MSERKGIVREYDNYVIPEKGKDTPENRALREKAMEEFKEKAKKFREEATK